MIKVHSPMVVDPDQHGGWELVLWAGEPFDFDIPFREILVLIAHTLGQDAVHDLELPPVEEGDEFVEGSLRFETETLRIYYEHCLGYLAIMNEKEAVLQDVLNRLRPIVSVGL